METITIYKYTIGISLLVFWWLTSGFLTANPSETISLISVFIGILTAVAIILELALKREMKEKMEAVLDREIQERKQRLTNELEKLQIYLAEKGIPSYSESGVEGLEQEFQDFDSIKSKYTFTPKILHSTILVIISSLILIIFWTNPTIWVAQSPSYPDLTLAHIGLFPLCIAIWLISSMLLIALEIKIWEKE